MVSDLEMAENLIRRELAAAVLEKLQMMMSPLDPKWLRRSWSTLPGRACHFI